VRLVRWLGAGGLPNSMAEPANGWSDARLAGVAGAGVAGAVAMGLRMSGPGGRQGGGRGVAGAGAVKKVISAVVAALAGGAATKLATGAAAARLNVPRRPTDPEFAADHAGAFNDGFPMLLISDASLDGRCIHIRPRLTYT